ncbi:hypothetical protein NKDENANG_03698 [Candidatus Entotheonellaceae bacterium PAL068K]
MLIVNVCIVGGVVYAGLKTWSQRRPRKSKAWLTARRDQEQRDAWLATEAGGSDQSELHASRSCIISTISLGLSISGAFGYRWLSLVSVPLTVYTAIPVFEHAFVTLFSTGRRYMSIVGSAAIIVTLTTQRYIVASLLTWLYDVMTLLGHRVQRLNHLLLHEFEQSCNQFLAQVYGAKPRSVWVLVNGIDIELPFEDLKVGDTVLVREREVIAVDGTIVDGTAVVSRWLSPGSGRPESRGPGDRVVASSLVLSGRICVRVENV